MARQHCFSKIYMKEVIHVSLEMSLISVACVFVHVISSNHFERFTNCDSSVCLGHIIYSQLSLKGEENFKIYCSRVQLINNESRKINCLIQISCC